MALAPAVPATPATPENPYDAMASAFDTLLDSSSTEDEPKVEAPETPEAPEAAAPETPETPEAAAPETPETPATPEAPETPPVEAAPSDDDAELRARLAALEAKTSAPAEEKPPVEAVPPDTRAPVEVYAPDEKEFLTAYQKEWPDVSKGEALLRRAEYQQLVTHIFSEVARVYGPLVERGVQAAETVGDTTALAAIREMHGDYNDAMYDSVVEWANGLTGYRKKLAQGVIAEGEPQDVVDLITEYKSAKGLNKPKVVAAAPAAATTAVTELSATAKKAAKALGVVDSKRSAASPQGGDPDDFDGAWDEAVGK